MEPAEVSYVRSAPYPETVINLPWKSRPALADPEPAVTLKQARVRLLNEELSQLRAAAVERTRTTDTKASFLVVAAGFLAGVAGSELVNADTWFIGLVPLSLTLATVVVSAMALWPRALSVPSARFVVNQYVDADMTPESLEDHLLEIRTKEVEKRNEQNESKAGLTKWGFILLIAAMASSLAVVVVTAILGV